MALDLLRDLLAFAPKEAKRYVAPDFTERSPIDALRAMAATLHPTSTKRILKEAEAIVKRVEKEAQKQTAAAR